MRGGRRWWWWLRSKEEEVAEIRVSVSHRHMQPGRSTQAHTLEQGRRGNFKMRRRV